MGGVNIVYFSDPEIRYDESRDRINQFLRFAHAAEVSPSRGGTNSGRALVVNSQRVGNTRCCSWVLMEVSSARLRSPLARKGSRYALA